MSTKAKSLKRPRSKFVMTAKCPFCKGNAWTSDSGDEEYWVECMKASCRSMGPLRPSSQAAIKAWNRRKQ